MSPPRFTSEENRRMRGRCSGILMLLLAANYCAGTKPEVLIKHQSETEERLEVACENFHHYDHVPWSFLPMNTKRMAGLLLILYIVLASRHVCWNPGIQKPLMRARWTEFMLQQGERYWSLA
ncbi:hypothetical protein LINPERHAP2_LOCUS42832 [Linum perenne]